MFLDRVMKMLLVAAGSGDWDLAIPGVEVGHWSDPVAETGCTVVVLPEPNCVAAEFRGAAVT